MYVVAPGQLADALLAFEQFQHDLELELGGIAFCHCISSISIMNDVFEEGNFHIPPQYRFLVSGPSQ
jgi:hypothetical protein